MLLPSGSSKAKYGMYHSASIANRNELVVNWYRGGILVGFSQTFLIDLTQLSQVCEVKRIFTVSSRKTQKQNLIPLYPSLSLLLSSQEWR